MEKSDECRRYKWSNLATKLLVSIWCHDLVQNQLKISSRNQPIWESIARYMSRKGFLVTGLQCKNRIKNMLCSYHEAVRKNDPSGIEPYYNIFKKVLSNKGSRKKDLKATRVQRAQSSESTEDDNNISLDSTLLNSNQSVNLNKLESEYQINFLDISNQDSQYSCTLNSNGNMKELENLIVKAIDSQTKAITNAIQLQSQIIEKLLVAEREKLEMIMTFEKEGRRQLETRLDRLLSKLEANIVPQITYMGTLIDTRQNQ